MIWFLRLLIGYWRGALFCILIYTYLRLPNGNRRVFPAAYTKVPYPLLLFDSTGAAGIAACRRKALPVVPGSFDRLLCNCFDF